MVNRDRKNTRRIPHVRMNNYKKSNAFTKTTLVRKPSIFGKLTSITSEIIPITLPKEGRKKSLCYTKWDALVVF